MTRKELLELERLADSGSDLNKIRTANPELFKTLEAKVGAARRQTVLTQFSNASTALRARLKGANFPIEGNVPFDRMVANAIGGTGTSPEVLKEAATRLAELDRTGTLADPADLTWDPLESTCRHASLSIL